MLEKLRRFFLEERKLFVLKLHEGLHQRPQVHHRTLDHVLLVNSGSVVPANCEQAFPGGRASLGLFSFWEKGGDDIQETGFSIPARSDASNSRRP
jgi:hypothetical protein